MEEAFENINTHGSLISLLRQPAARANTKSGPRVRVTACAHLTQEQRGSTAQQCGVSRRHLSSSSRAAEEMFGRQGNRRQWREGASRLHSHVPTASRRTSLQLPRRTRSVVGQSVLSRRLAQPLNPSMEWFAEGNSFRAHCNHFGTKSLISRLEVDHQSASPL